MRTLTISAALVVAMMPGAAAAESWRMAAANEGAVMYVDTDSQVRRGDMVLVTVMTVALPSQPGDWDRSVILREIDCRASRSTMLDRSFYEGPRLISSSRTREAPDAHAPGTMMGGVVEVACGQRAYQSGVVANPYADAMAQLRGAATGRK